MSEIYYTTSPELAIHKVTGIVDSLARVMPLLVVPIALSTLVMILVFQHKRKNFTESLPFIIMQVNTIFSWTSTGWQFIYNPVFGPFGCNYSYSNYFLPNLFGKAYMVDSLGIFIYTWVFLDAVVERTAGTL